MNKTKTKNKRAFTLTELLIVVIVIGVLSAVTLPKFNRVIENRKVTEAEEMMSAVRMEQERRCTLDQNYTTNFDSLSDVMSDVIASANTKNYTYSLQSQGISAKSNSGDYTLKILSYEDGSYCCTGEGCKKLNKNYPDCAGLSFPTSNCAGTEGAITPPGTEPTPGEPEAPECTDGAVQGSQVCNGCGTQTTQKCVNGKWTNVLGTCSKTAEECAPKPQCPTKPADVVKQCECGTVTATHRCDASTNYTWVQEAFPACPAKPEAVTETCSDGKTVRTKTFTCVNNVWTAGEWDKECEESECVEGDVSGEQVCNDCGTQTTLKCVNGKWTESLGTCSKTWDECKTYAWERYPSMDCVFNAASPENYFCNMASSSSGLGPLNVANNCAEVVSAARSDWGRGNIKTTSSILSGECSASERDTLAYYHTGYGGLSLGAAYTYGCIAYVCTMQ